MSKELFNKSFDGYEIFISSEGVKIYHENLIFRFIIKENKLIAQMPLEIHVTQEWLDNLKINKVNDV